MVRVEVYNSTQLKKTNGTTITVEELKHAFENGSSEVLDHYVDWYYTENGEEDSREYWSELNEIAIEYYRKNPEIAGIDARELNIAQLQELISKKNNPAYEIDMEVLKGEE